MGTLQWSVGSGKRSYRRAESVVKLRRGVYALRGFCYIPASGRARAREKGSMRLRGNDAQRRSATLASMVGITEYSLSRDMRFRSLSTEDNLR